ncbi:uncharacterized protein LOC134236976 [Saccostrea cucullata]|uniref:uncharacterized protein LOC134236976 n=1 Tax=Saccostrea cuccullata TaxID=36930 RepID=UPI002ED1D7E8
MAQVSNSRAKLPKLPVFEESKDCIDSYLQRFERFAANAKWEESIWAINLSALLKGKALEVYSRLPASQALNYRTLKQALLKRFQLTEEGFHSKFRTSKPDQGESPSQFFARIDNYVEKWLNLAKSPRTYEGLKDLVLREQFMNSCSRSLAMFLIERHTGNVENISNLADQFIEAHGYSSFRKVVQVFQKTYPSEVQKGLGNRNQNQVSKRQSDPQQTKERKCYICHKQGTLRKTVTRNKVCIVQRRSLMLDRHASRLNAAWKMVSYVKVLRDSGCSGIVVKRDLVKDTELTGKVQKCVLIDGTVRQVEEAVIDVDTPFYVGKIHCGKVADRETHLLQAVQTRSQKVREEKGMKKLKVKDSIDIDVNVDKMKELQTTDESLIAYRNLAKSGKKKHFGDCIVSWFSVDKGLLYRYFQSSKVSDNKTFKQVIIPESLRRKVMTIPHDSILGGHLGTKKTADRITSSFYWPGIQGDIKRYCQSCDVCQRTFPKGKVPFIEDAFDRHSGIWFEVIHHAVNEHEWILPYRAGGRSSCQYGPLTEERDKDWLEAGSPAHVTVRAIVSQKANKEDSFLP